MFGRKKKETELNDLLEGCVICPQCQKKASINDKTPLSVTSCDSCSKGHIFVPMKIADLWLYKPLGGGAMGAVYKGFIERYPDLPVAVKILPRDQRYNPTLIANLQNEITIINDLGQHPCIVSIIDAGCDDDDYFLATEFIEGERLDKRINRLKKLPIVEVVSIGLRLLQGLTHIWNQGYLFRDMKPENTIVNDEGAYIFDYGICQRIEDAYKDQGDLVEGSPLYLPPERMVGDVEKAYSEIYSLGMVLFHCIKGEPFYKAKEANALARQHVRTLRLSNMTKERMEDIPPELSSVLKNMIAREPNQRYQSFLDVELAFTQVLLRFLKGAR